MKGLELCRKYYEKYGAGMIEEEFPELVHRAAAGLAGEGSECLGYDDEVSRDHDFEPSFCVWLTDSDFDKYSFSLSRAYSSLPREFMGISRTIDTPTGGKRRGVMRISDFYKRFLGSAAAPETPAHWLALPEYALRAATSGEVFRDDLGEFSAVRNALKKGYPEDVRLKKLASALIVASQSGEYNFERCLAHGESGAAQLAIFTFVKYIAAAIYLLNNAYMPFYKWIYRGMSELTVLSDLTDVLAFLTETGNSEKEANAKKGIISDLVRAVTGELSNQGLTKKRYQSFEESAYEVNSKIKSPELRNKSIFSGMIRE
jgi:hypothetical protein